MDVQEIIKLIAALGGLFCLVMGVVALFKCLKADGIIDVSALAKGKIKTGSAGVLLLFFGTILLAVDVMKGKMVRTSESDQDGVKIREREIYSQLSAQQARERALFERLEGESARLRQVEAILDSKLNREKAAAIDRKEREKDAAKDKNEP